MEIFLRSVEIILFLVIFFCSFCGGIIMTSTSEIVGCTRGAGLRDDGDDGDDAGDRDHCVRKDLS